MKTSETVRVVELQAAGAALPKKWEGNPAVKWGARLLLVWCGLTLVAPANLVACACSQVVIGSRAVSSNLNVEGTNGMLNVIQTDLDIPGIVPIEVTRLYNGGNNSFTLFGYAWELSGVSYLKTTSGDIEISNGGSIRTYKSADGYYDDGETGKLTFVSGTEVKVEDRRGNEWHYSLLTKTLNYTQDANGNQTSYTWKTVNKAISATETQVVYCPLTITYPDSRQTTFTYSTDTGYEYLCTSMTGPNSVTVSYSYTDGILTGVSQSSSQYLNYTYNLVNTDAGKKGWLSKITYASGAEVNVTWNGNYQNLDELRVTAVTGPHGYSHTFGYVQTVVTDGSNEVVSKQMTTAVTDSNGKQTTTVYPTNYFDGTVPTSSATTITDPLSNTLTTVKNAKNRMASYTNKRGKTTSYLYDESNTNPLLRDNQTRITNPLSKQTNLAYDSAGNLTKVTDPLSRDTVFEYDSHHNLTKVKNGLAQTVGTMTYTSAGLMATIKDGRNNQTEFTYNSNGYKTKVTDALSKEWNYTYDSSGNLLTLESSMGRISTYTYTPSRNISTMEDPLGNATSFDYDDMANLIKITDALGHETNTAYDLLQRATSVTDALSNVTTFTYDAEANLAKLTDALGREYSYTFDGVNRTKTFVYPDTTSEGYDYDANGNLTKLTDRSGAETTYVYDDADRLTTKTWEGSPDKVFACAYNDANQLTGITEDATTKASYTYDGAARMTAVTVNSRTVGYGYDDSQNLNEVTYPSTTVAGYVYDARNQLSQLKRDGSIIAAYTYDDDGRLVKKELGNGLEQVYTYDAGSRLTETAIREIATPTNIRQKFTYGYDAVGNRLYTKYLSGRGDVYQYDATYQVTGVKYDVTDPAVAYSSATGAARTVTYAYDAVGNRTSVVDGVATTTYTKNNLNQYTSVGGVNYTYSTRGEMTGDGTWTYTYDHEKRLVGASKSGMSASYTYDVLGRRSSKTVNSVTTNYVYAGQDLIEERDGSGTVTKRYVYEGGIDRPVQAVIGGSVYYFTQDVLGNVTALTDSSGAVMESYTYDVFGKPTIKDGSGTVISTTMTPFLFTGREYDVETGLYHYRARSYHPELGRFMQADPIDFNGGDANVYRYALNAPLNWRDPSGLLVTVHSRDVKGSGGAGAHTWVEVDDASGRNTYSGIKDANGNLGVKKDYPADFDAKKNGKQTGCVTVPPPPGMTQSQWDKAVRDAADKELKKDGTREYKLFGGDDNTKNGNCHVVSRDIIKNAGGSIPSAWDPPGAQPGLR